MNAAQKLRAMARDLLALADDIENGKQAPTTHTTAPKNGVEVAPDSDLDSEWGNPVIKYDPKKNWDGPSQAGKHYSECPVEYLNALASYLDWGARKKAEEGDEKVAGYRRKDAARARGWARRNAANGPSVPAKPANQAEEDAAGEFGRPGELGDENDPLPY